MRLLYGHIFRLPEGPDCAVGELHVIEEVHTERGGSPRVCAEVVSIARGAHLPAAKDDVEGRLLSEVALRGMLDNL